MKPSSTEWGWSKKTSILFRLAKLQLSLAALLVAQWIISSFANWKVHLLLLGITIILFLTFSLFGFWCRRSDRLLRQLTRNSLAAMLVQKIHRNEIIRFSLYLRPFDWTGMLPIKNPNYQPHEDPFSELPTMDLEEVMAQGMSSDIPMIALGWPGSSIGAGRYMAGDVAWCNEIELLAKKALLILVLPLYSSATMWEIYLLSDRAWLGKTVFIMPPQIGPYPVIMVSRWQKTQVSLKERGIHLPNYDSNGMLFVMDTNGRAVLRNLSFPSSPLQVKVALRILLPEIGL